MTRDMLDCDDHQGLCWIVTFVKGLWFTFITLQILSRVMLDINVHQGLCFILMFPLIMPRCDIQLRWVMSNCYVHLWLTMCDHNIAMVDQSWLWLCYIVTFMLVDLCQITMYLNSCIRLQHPSRVISLFDVPQGLCFNMMFLKRMMCCD
jgi:hypothetical protein